MTTLSTGTISGLAASAGFTGNDINIATAVAMAESGGNPDAHNTKPPDDSYGLWQINMLGSLGPTRRNQFHIANNARLFDPQTNANAAYKVFTSSGWQAWTTYKTGAYKSFLDTTSTLTDLKDKLTPNFDIAGAIDSVGKNVYKGASNLTGVIVAIVLLVLGVVILLRNQILPAKKVLKVAKGLTS